jgi:PTH1 family peptidyl-tRNA hydrolase
MNLSGRAFRYYFDKEKIALENTLTVVDDLALPLSKLRLRGSGTHAGHNGLKDIQAILATDEYPKLRFGIGNDYAKGAQVNFVLGRWTEIEMPVVKTKIDKCVETIENFVFIGLSRAMNLVNNQTFV